MNRPDRSRIRKWMIAHLTEFLDECGEIDTTDMVEQWDSQCDTGDATLDTAHIAWEIASEIAEKFEPTHSFDRKPIRQNVRRQLID